MQPMSDRLRELLDLVIGSLDDPATDGRALAGRAGFSRDHLDRLLAAASDPIDWERLRSVSGP